MNSAAPRPSDRWIPYYIVAFFLVMIATLVPMGLIAVKTNTGVVTDNAYQKGLNYNHDLQAAAEQQALHWTHRLTLDPIDNGQKLKARFTLFDTERKPLGGAEVKLWLVRPTQAGMDQSVTLIAADSAGSYAGEIPVPTRGQWEARVSALRQGHNYQVSQRITLP